VLAQRSEATVLRRKHVDPLQEPAVLEAIRDLVA
jgi:hypothetical protein